MLVRWMISWTTIWYIFTLVEGPICGKSSLQSIVDMSTLESKYMTIAKLLKKLYDYWGNGVSIKLNFKCIVLVRLTFT